MNNSTSRLERGKVGNSADVGGRVCCSVFVVNEPYSIRMSFLKIRYVRRSKKVLNHVSIPLPYIQGNILDMQNCY